MTRKKYLARAKAWDDAGRPDELLITHEYDMLAMRCWFQSKGAEQEGRDQVVADFGDACEKSHERHSPRWWDMLLQSRDHCCLCGERYMVENLSVCTACLDSFCFNCVGKQLAPNGNPLHACGGEIVG
jgi:hypothetical protein